MIRYGVVLCVDMWLDDGWGRFLDVGDVFGVETEDKFVVLEEGDGGFCGGSWRESGALGEGFSEVEPWKTGKVENMTNIVRDVKRCELTAHVDEV